MKRYTLTILVLLAGLATTAQNGLDKKIGKEIAQISDAYEDATDRVIKEYKSKRIKKRFKRHKRKLKSVKKEFALRKARIRRTKRSTTARKIKVAVGN